MLAVSLWTLASDVAQHTAEVALQAHAALPQWVHTNRKGRAHQPDDTDYDPTSEEAGTEDVACTVQRHGPQHKKDQGHRGGGDLRDLTGTEEFALLLCFGGIGLAIIGLMTLLGTIFYLRSRM